MHNRSLFACLLAATALTACRGDEGREPSADQRATGAADVAPIAATDGRRQSTGRVLPDSARDPAAAADPAAVINMTSGPPVHLVDAAGASLYLLKDNTDGSRCDAICEEAWPPVVITAQQAQAGTGLDSARLGNTPRPDGSLQVRYGNNPLYRYAGDRGAGRTSGHGVTDKWGEWSLVGLDGNPVTAQVPESSERPAAPATQAPRQ